MRPDEMTDRNSQPVDQGRADLDLANRFERTMPATPAVDVDRLLASFKCRSAARESSVAAIAVRRSIFSCKVHVPFTNWRIRMATKVAAVLLLAVPVALMLLLTGTGGTSAARPSCKRPWRTSRRQHTQSR